MFTKNQVRLAVLGSVAAFALGAAPAAMANDTVSCDLVVGDSRTDVRTYQLPAESGAYEHLFLHSRGYVANVKVKTHEAGVVVDMMLELDGEEPAAMTEAGFARLRSKANTPATDYVDLKLGRLTCRVS